MLRIYAEFMLFILGDVLGALCTLIGPSVFRDIRDTVLLGVRKNLEVRSHDCNVSGSSSELPQVSITANLLR